MAKRYSGDLQINVTYDDHNFYRASVSRGGKLLWRGTVSPASAGFGPGVAYDSPQAYDEIASSVLSFADDEVGNISDTAEYDENLTGYLIRRTPRAKTTSHAAKKARLKGATLAFPATKRTKPRIMVRKVNGRWQPVNTIGNVVRGTVFNADGSGYLTRLGAEEAAIMLRQFGESA